MPRTDVLSSSRTDMHTCLPVPCHHLRAPAYPGIRPALRQATTCSALAIEIASCVIYDGACPPPEPAGKGEPLTLGIIVGLSALWSSTLLLKYVG